MRHKGLDDEVVEGAPGHAHHSHRPHPLPHPLLHAGKVRVHLDEAQLATPLYELVRLHDQSLGGGKVEGGSGREGFGVVITGALV